MVTLAQLIARYREGQRRVEQAQRRLEDAKRVAFDAEMALRSVQGVSTAVFNNRVWWFTSDGNFGQWTCPPEDGHVSSAFIHLEKTDGGLFYRPVGTEPVVVAKTTDPTDRCAT